MDDYVATSGLKDDLRNFTFAAWINIDSVPDPYDALSNSDHSAGGVYITLRVTADYAWHAIPHTPQRLSIIAMWVFGITWPSPTILRQT